MNRQEMLSGSGIMKHAQPKHALREWHPVTQRSWQCLADTVVRGLWQVPEAREPLAVPGGHRIELRS